MRAFDVTRFVTEREASWSRLEHLLLQVERDGLGSLRLHGAREFGRLYRAVSSDLIRARSELVNATVVDYLNDIVARSYAVLHASTGRQRRRVRDFFLLHFPRTFRREWRMVAVAAGLLFGGAALGGTLFARDDAARGVLIPEDHQEHTPEERVRRDERAGGGVHGDSSVAFSGWLFTHNIQVSFLVFALGLTLGIGTAVVLFYNGVPLGALAMQYHAQRLDLFFWSWILPHGVTELTVVCIAGGAGLILGRGLWLPGARSRRDALVTEAKTAATLVLGGMPLLVLAGVVEATVSQMHAPLLPYPVKLLFAALLAAGVYAFLLLAGRGDADA